MDSEGVPMSYIHPEQLKILIAMYHGGTLIQTIDHLAQTYEFKLNGKRIEEYQIPIKKGHKAWIKGDDNDKGKVFWKLRQRAYNLLQKYKYVK